MCDSDVKLVTGHGWSFFVAELAAVMEMQPVRSADSTVLLPNVQCNRDWTLSIL